MKTKSVGYFYPTSPLAERFNLNDGGFCVEVIINEGTPQVQTIHVAGFQTREEADRAAETFPYPYSRFTI